MKINVDYFFTNQNKRDPGQGQIAISTNFWMVFGAEFRF